MPYKILIVEDDPVIQTQLQTLLTGNGYTAVIADPPASAPDTVKELSPHLVLMDIRLPGESGFSLCSKIRAFSSVPIFFVTSCSGDMDELSSFLLGGDGFITKPYNTAILLAKISALLKRIYGAGGGDAFSHRGAVLRKMGVEENDIDKLILKQLCVWFGLPVTVAIAVAAILAVYFFKTIQRQLAAYMGTEALLLRLLATFGVLTVLLACYFASTQALFKSAAGRG